MTAPSEELAKELTAMAEEWSAALGDDITEQVKQEVQDRLQAEGLLTQDNRPRD